MSARFDKNDSELAPLLEHLGERFNRVFAYFFCALEYENDEDMRADPTHKDRSLMLQIIENGCLHETLIALRDLDDFFLPRTAKTKPDDLKAPHFGLNKKLCFLTAGEWDNINKLVAHTTTGAQSHGFRWDILELLTKGISQTLEFLKWVEQEYGVRYFYLHTAAMVVRKKVKAMHSFITREAEKRRRPQFKRRNSI